MNCSLILIVSHVFKRYKSSSAEGKHIELRFKTLNIIFFHGIKFNFLNFNSLGTCIHIRQNFKEKGISKNLSFFYKSRDIIQCLVDM